MRYNIYDGSDNLICRANLADTLLSRGLGLMFKKDLPRDEGLLIKFPKYIKSYSIHSFFMRFTIDLIFLDTENRILDLFTLKPWSLYSPKSPCDSVLEVNEGFITKNKLMRGSRIKVEKVKD